MPQQPSWWPGMSRQVHPKPKGHCPPWIKRHQITVSNTVFYFWDNNVWEGHQSKGQNWVWKDTCIFAPNYWEVSKVKNFQAYEAAQISDNASNAVWLILWKIAGDSGGGKHIKPEAVQGRIQCFGHLWRRSHQEPTQQTLCRHWCRSRNSGKTNRYD